MIKYKFKQTNRHVLATSKHLNEQKCSIPPDELLKKRKILYTSVQITTVFFFYYFLQSTLLLLAPDFLLTAWVIDWLFLELCLWNRFYFNTYLYLISDKNSFLKKLSSQVEFWKLGFTMVCFWNIIFFPPLHRTCSLSTIFISLSLKLSSLTCNKFINKKEKIINFDLFMIYWIGIALRPLPLFKQGVISQSGVSFDRQLPSLCADDVSGRLLPWRVQPCFPVDQWFPSPWIPAE